MSVIDSKIVKMVFDNAEFEAGVKTSMNSLDNLKTKLNFSGAENSLSEVSAAANRLSFGSLVGAVENVGQKFSALETIAVGALLRIGEQAVEAGEKIVKSVTIDQVTQGWNKYEEKTRSVQTIMAATASEFKDTGEQMEYVNAQLDKLNWFTDETSYNFIDMTSNIGKFTSTGQKLDASVTAMQGIANWAAISGANAAEASRAMYNLSQAMGVGSVKLMDWKSIENANMATKEFKETVLETAASMGTLKKVSEGVYETTKGTTVTFKDFNSALKDEWFTSEVLMKSLDKYGAATNKLYDLSEAADTTATDILTLVEAQKKGEISTEALLDAMGSSSTMTVEEFGSAIQELSSNEYEFGIKAFKAAQEAKTLSDAIDATKDAASTGWMNIYETIFGDYETARHVWTDFANFLYDTMVAPLETIQDVLDDWIEIEGARDRFFDIFRNFTGAVGSWFAPIKEAFHTIFEPLTGGQLDKAITKIGDFFKAITLDSDSVDYANLKQIFENVFTIIKNIGKAAKEAFQLVKPVLQMIGPLISRALEITNMVTGSMLNGLSKLKDKIVDIFTGKYADDSVPEGFVKLKDRIFGASDASGKFTGILEKFHDALSKVKEKLDPFVEKVKEFAKNSIEWVKNFSLVNFVTEKITNALSKLKSILSKVGEIVKDIFKWIKENISLTDILTGSIVTGISSGILKKAFSKKTTLTSIISDFLDSANEGLGEKLKNVFEPLKDTLDSVTGYFNSKKIDNVADGLLKVGKALLAISAAVLILSFVKMNDIQQAMMAFAEVLILMGGALSALSLSKVKAPAIAAAGAAILMMAGAMLVMSVALAAFSLVAKYFSAVGGFAAMVLTMASVVGMLVALTTLCKPGPLLAAASAVLVVASSLLIMAAALAVFALFANMDSFAKGFIAMIGTVATITAVLLAFSGLMQSGLIQPSQILATAAAFLVISSALLVLSAALGVFALVAMLPSAWSGFLLMAAAITAITLALMALANTTNPANILATAASLMIAAVAVDLLSAGMLVMAASIALLTACNPERLGNALATLAVALGVAVVALIALGSVGPVVLAGAAALAVAALAIAALSVALGVLGLALPILSTGLSSFADALLTIGENIAAIIYDIHDAIGRGIEAIIEGVGKGIANTIEFIGNAIADFIEKVEELGESLTDISIGITDFGESVRSLEGISWLTTAAGIVAIANAIKSLNKNKFDASNTAELVKFTAAIREFVSIANSVASAAESIIESMKDIGSKMVQSFADGITYSGAYAYNAGIDVSMQAYAGASYCQDWLHTTGWNMIIGLANGVYDASGYVYDACYNVVSTAIGYANAAAQVHSPSRKMMELGDYMDKGLALGLRKGSDIVESEAFDVVYSVVGIASKAAEIAEETISGEYTPVITPVVDMDSVISSASSIQSLLSSSGGFIATGISSDLATGIQMERDRIQNGVETQKVIAQLDETALSALRVRENQRIAVENHISFEGALSQLASLLRPYIVTEATRIGPSLIDSK